MVKSHEVLGERRIIEVVMNCLELPKMPIPFGDDVSAHDIGEGKIAVLKTDMLVDKTDVPQSMSLWQASRKAVVMNISDFAAKGVKPLAILVSLGLPRKLTEKDVKEIGAGLNAGAREYGAYVIGGDTNEASDLVISISLFGTAKKAEVILRSGAKPGDIVAVTGFFGKTAAGMKILLENFDAPKEIINVLVDSVLMPKARLKEGLSLCRTGAVTASIDSSDGLAWSLYEISKASKVGFLIDNLPIAEEAEEFARIHNLDPFDLAFYGGEEYELVLTLKPELLGKAEKAVKLVGGKLLSIGKVTAERRILFEVDGEKRVIEPRGWEHFK
ncbi:MAG: thiamine-phosphate kinase [Candidatus Bathyarchaeales archaeon]